MGLGASIMLGLDLLLISADEPRIPTGSSFSVLCLATVISAQVR